MKLREDFFARKSEEVAPRLLGMSLVRNINDEITRGIITETQSYTGRNRKDTDGILYPAGKIYISPFMWYKLLNISTEAEDVPSCVLISKVRIGNEIYGTGRLTRKLSIDKEFDGKSIENDELWIDTMIDYLSPKDTKFPPTCTGKYRLRTV